MKTDLQAGQLSGTLPILYVFLARSGKTIRDVSPIALDDKGAAYFANENPGPNATRGVRILFAGSDGVEKTLYYFSTDLSNSGVRVSRLSEVLRNAGARQQPDQERVLSAALRQLHHRARLHPRQQRHHHPGRFRRSARLLRSEANGGSFRSAATSARSTNFPGGTSRTMPSCSGAASRSISASAIAGARMNPTCCCRSGCPRTVQAASTPRHRPNRRRRHRAPGECRVRRRDVGEPQRGFRWFWR